MRATPAAADLAGLLRTLGGWQRDGSALQLHPGDVGWATRWGPERAAAAVRTWWRGAEPVALGLVDGPDVVRLAVAPDHAQDVDLAVELADDLADGPPDVEARTASALVAELARRGWGEGDRWTSLAMDLDQDPDDPALPAGVGVERVDEASAADWSRVLASAFAVTTDPHVADQRWRHLTEGPAADLLDPVLLRDATGEAVAVAGAWSAGAGRPGLIEPLGVHADHRGRGLGRTATLAAVAALRRRGCSSATVATPSANVGAVATYLSAGCREVATTHDLRRPS